MFRSRTSSSPKKNYAFSAFCESDSASKAVAVLGAALISLFKLAAPPRKPEASSTTRACLSQTGAGWYLTPLVFACGLGTHGDAAKRKRNENKPKKANLVFCTTDNTNSPPTDQSVDYSVLSPRTNEAPLDDGDPIQCSRPAAFTPWNVVSTPTTPTTSCPHNPLQYKYYMTPTGCAPLTGRNRSCPIISWLGH